MKKNIFIIPVLIGALLSVFGVKTLIQAYDSRDWSVCEGTITHSEIDIRTREVKKNDRWRTETTYHAMIEYSYEINDTVYSSDNISFGGRSSGRDDVNQTVAYYHKGKTVDVYFDPETPSESVLEPGVTSGAYMPLTIGLFFAAVGIFIIKPKTSRQTSG